MTDYRVTVLPGDGTGKEVIAEAMRVLSVFEENAPISFEITEIPCGGQYYLETGKEWPEGSFEHCRDNSDAILLGAILLIVGLPISISIYMGWAWYFCCSLMILPWTLVSMYKELREYTFELWRGKWWVVGIITCLILFDIWFYYQTSESVFLLSFELVKNYISTGEI